MATEKRRIMCKGCGKFFLSMTDSLGHDCSRLAKWKRSRIGRNASHTKRWKKDLEMFSKKRSLKNKKEIVVV